MKVITLIIFGYFLTLPAFALPVGEVISLDEGLGIAAENAEGYDFNGIIGLSNCSGAIVRFADQPDDSKAYVLTNGHCIGSFFSGFLKPGEVRYNEQSNRSMNAFIDVNNTIRVRAERLVYATMTDTDAALYRLTDTYEQLSREGVDAFELSAERPELDEEIHIVSGYWKTGFECHIEHFVYELREADWTMRDSIRYSAKGCEVYGGTSGSPIIRKGDRVVIGVNNTGNESGKACKMNNPCEVDEKGNKTVIRDRGYGQQTYWFASCLNADFDIDLNVKGCILPRPQEFNLLF